MPAKLPRLSPSGAKTISRCMTKWWFEKIGGRRSPTTPAQSIGLAIHERAENYIQTGAYGFPDDDPIVQLVVPGQKFLDDMRQGYLHRGGQVEKLYKVPKGEWPVPVFCRTDYVESAYGLVVDHKSTKDIYSQYVPTPFDLANDDQMLWYGYMEWRNDPNPPETYEVQHTYFSSVAPASRVVRVRTTWEKTMLVAKKFGEIAHTMFDAAQVLQPEELEFNLDACSDYRGCPHQAYCPHLQDRVGGLSRLRTKLKKQSAPTDKPQRQEKPTMGFRDRKRKEAEARAAAEAATEAPAPTPGAGQGNPPDTPGTETPTEAQLEEVGDAILEALGPDAPNAAIATWLAGDGNEALVRAGLGRPHIARVLKFWTGDEGDEGDAGDVETNKGDVEGDVESHPVVALLQEAGGKVRLHDKKLSKAIRDATGVGRLTVPTKMQFLSELNDEGLLDYNTVWVFLPDLSDEVASPAAAKPAKPKLEVVEEPPADAPEETDEETSDTPEPFQLSPKPHFIIGVGCLPQDASYDVENIDDLLEDYYEVAHTAAVDENGKKVGDLILWAYNKGPKTVQALVSADVREGKGPTVNGFVFVSKGHFMEPYLGLMFPDAPIFRGF